MKINEKPTPVYTHLVCGRGNNQTPVYERSVALHPGSLEQEVHLKNKDQKSGIIHNEWALSGPHDMSFWSG